MRESVAALTRNDKRHTPAISSFAAPAEADIATFESLPVSERRALLKAEIEDGLQGAPREITADEIIARASARLADA